MSFFVADGWTVAQKQTEVQETRTGEGTLLFGMFCGTLHSNALESRDFMTHRQHDTLFLKEMGDSVCLFDLQNDELKHASSIESVLSYPEKGKGDAIAMHSLPHENEKVNVVSFVSS